VRPYRPSDLPAFYDICVRTADAGEDARGKYSSDALMGDLFAAPYAHMCPDLAFVLDDGGAAVGYIVGTADTEDFVRRWRTEWLPGFAATYPPPAAPAGDPVRDPEQDMVALGYRPEHMLGAQLAAAYPAHLHIDVLPPYQGQGHGRRLMEAFLAAVARAGAPAVHLGMLTANVKARAFYDRLGFIELPVADPGPLTYLGRPTG